MNRYLLTLFCCLLFSTLHAQHGREIQPTSSFTIKGSVKREITFRAADLLKFRQDTIGDVVVRNHQGAEKEIAHSMKGVLLTTLLDSAGIYAEKHKEYSELCIVLVASDGYKNVYSWSELYNTEIGKHVFVITAIDGKAGDDIPGRILVMSMKDINSGARHLKALDHIEVKKVD